MAARKATPETKTLSTEVDAGTVSDVAQGHEQAKGPFPIDASFAAVNPSNLNPSLLRPAVGVTGGAKVLAGILEVAVAEQQRLGPGDAGVGDAAAAVVTAVVERHVVAVLALASLLGGGVVEAAVRLLAEAERVGGAGPAGGGEDGYEGDELTRGQHLDCSNIGRLSVFLLTLSCILKLRG